MNQKTVQAGDGPSSERDDRGAGQAAFRNAQRELFEQVGLEARSRFVDLEDPDVRTHVIEAGPPIEELPSGDAPIAFVHWTAAFGAFLAPLMAEFDDVPTVAFDRPGYGLSGEFVYGEGALRGTLVDCLRGVLDELDLERVDLVGHSMGGYASVQFALAYPDRVRRLALVGSVPTFPGTQPPLPFRLMAAPGLGRLLARLQKPGVEGVLDFAEVFGERESVQRYPALVRAIAAQQADPPAADAGRSELGALISVRGWRPSIRIREDELRAIQQPTLVVWGEHDPLGSPADVRAGVESIPDARLETVPAAHAPFFDYPEVCARLVREHYDATSGPLD